MLRTTPNTVQRHLETLWHASVRATRTSDTDGMLASGAMRDVRIGNRVFLDPPFYIVETLSERNTHYPS